MIEIVIIIIAFYSLYWIMKESDKLVTLKRQRNNDEY